MTERIHYLDSLRAIAIIMVVGVHTLSYCQPLPDSQYAIISFIIHTVAVPIFFLVDGYLFARSITPSKEYNYFNSVKKSAHRLLVPWVIFTIIYSISRYFFEISNLTKEMLIVGHSLQDVVISSYGSVYSGQMYFLASLFIIRLCGPVFRRIVLINSYLIIILLFVVYLVAYKYGIGYITPYLKIAGGQEPVLHALWGAQFYFVGIIISKVYVFINIKKMFLLVFSLLIVSLFMYFELGYLKYFVLQYLYLLSLFFLFALIGRKMVLLDFIGKNTMGIYLIHVPIVLKSVSLISNKIIFIPIVSFFVILISSLLLSLLITIIINRVPYGGILFGQTNKVN